MQQYSPKFYQHHSEAAPAHLPRLNAAANCERNIDMMCDSVYQFTECFSLFIGGSDIKKNQFICTFPCIQCTQFNRIAGIADSFRN